MIFRKDKIIHMCRDKSVLHLGFIQHAHLYIDLIKNGEWLHEKINEVTKNLIGLDYLKEEIKILRSEYGYECYYADVTKLEECELNKKFDVIVCGELIEHVENAGLMLDGIKKFMHDNSVLIITTPNPWSKERMRLIKNGHLEIEWINSEHTCWYSYQTLKQLLERKQYIEILYSYYYCQSARDLISLKNRIINFLEPIYDLYRLKKEYMFDGLFFIAKLKN